VVRGGEIHGEKREPPKPREGKKRGRGTSGNLQKKKPTRERAGKKEKIGGWAHREGRKRGGPRSQIEEKKHRRRGGGTGERWRRLHLRGEVSERPHIEKKVLRQMRRRWSELGEGNEPRGSQGRDRKRAARCSLMVLKTNRNAWNL